MMWEEFQEIAGYEVSYDTYSRIIEPMYSALPGNVTKQQFVSMLDKKAFALPTKQQMVRKMRKLAQEMFEMCGLCSIYDEEQELRKLAYEYAERFYGVRRDDLNSWCILTRRYAYCGVIQERGCSCPVELVIGRDMHGSEVEYARIALVKLTD